MNLKDALGTADYICILDEAPTACAYGPYSPEGALEFCATYNEFNKSVGVEGRWVAVPVLPAQDFPTVKDK